MRPQISSDTGRVGSQGHSEAPSQQAVMLAADQPVMNSRIRVERSLAREFCTDARFLCDCSFVLFCSAFALSMIALPSAICDPA